MTEPTILYLTEKQHAIFTWLYDQTRQTGVQPSYAEIAAHFQYKSRNAAANHIRALHKAGWLHAPGIGTKKGTGTTQSRSMKFLKNPDGTEFTGFSTPARAQEPNP